MDHAIKRRRAQRLSHTGRYPATYLAISQHIPEAVVARLSAPQLAALIDAMDACSKEGQRLTCDAAVDEGAIWDRHQRRLRVIA